MDFELRATPVPPPEPERQLGDPAVSWERLRQDVQRWNTERTDGAYTDMPYVAAAIRGGLNFYGGGRPPLARLLADPSFRFAHSFVKIPREFVRRSDPDAPEPPMARLKRQRNALHLLLLLATRADRNLAREDGEDPALLPSIAPGGLATLLGYRIQGSLDLAVDTGTQAIRRARDKLVDEGLIEWEPDGQNWRIRMLSMRGDRSPWRTGMRGNDHAATPYLRLPSGLSRNGWLSVLPTKAVVALLVGMDRVALEKNMTVALTPSRTRPEYAVSHRMVVEGLGVLGRIAGAASNRQRRMTSTNAPDDWASVGAWRMQPSQLQTSTPLFELPPWLQHEPVSDLPGEPTGGRGEDPAPEEVTRISNFLSTLVNDTTVVEPDPEPAPADTP